MGTLIERLRAFIAKKPFRVWRALQAWGDGHDADIAWAWYADMCGIYEGVDSLDPIEIAKADGMRQAFFILWDMSNTNGRDILEVQRTVLGESGGE